MFNHILNYANATLIASLISFITLPFFTQYLSPADFGILAIYAMFGGLLANFLSIGLQAATIRYYYKEKNNIKNFQTLNFTNFIFIIFSLIIGGIIVYFSSSYISLNIFNNKVSSDLLNLSFIGGSLTFLFTYLKQLLIAQSRSKEYALLTIISALLAPLIAISLILFNSMTYDGRIIGYIITHLLFLMILLIMQRNYFRIKWSTNSLKRSLSYSYPTIPQQLIELTHQSFDKTLLTNMKGLDTVGHYQIGQKIGGIAKTFITVFGAAWMPFFMNRAEQGTKPLKLEIVNRYHELVLIYNYICILLCCFSEEVVIILMAESFYPSMYIIPLVVFYIFFSHTLSMISKPQIVFSEKLAYTLPPSIIALIINILLNIILIPQYGAIGAVTATAVASIFSGLLLFYYGQKLFPLPINYSNLIYQLISFTLFLGIIYSIMPLQINFILKIIIKSLLIVIYVIFTLKMNFINKDKLFRMIKTKMNNFN